jgi:serine/threonine-protein kinase
MGEVYEAERIDGGGAAAVKVLARGALGDRNKVARFVRELEIAGKLDAPNVVRVLEIGEPGSELPYLAMERLRGQDLAELMRERRSLPIGEVVDLARGVAAGLGAAHAAGIVHRDLKPSNVFRHDEGGGRLVWKILDFGVSKLAGSGELTRDVVIGTPGYMAPEQARGGEADARADVYALAAIAYKALTGSAPFSGTDVPATLFKVVHKMPVRPGELAPVSADVDAVLAVGLAKDAEQRFASAGELADALAAAARGQLGEHLRERARTVLTDRAWGAA